MKSVLASLFAILIALGVASTSVPAFANASFVNAGTRADGAG